MFKAVLFDLDGTLLKLDVDEFLAKYIKALGLSVKNYISTEVFSKILLESTNVMVHDNRPEKTNEDVFMEHFFKLSQGKREVLQPLFEQFYLEEFPNLGKEYSGANQAQEVIAHCKDKGLKVVLATNPVFPKQAVLERLKWAGLRESDFDLVSCYEEMHFCKPNVNYYKEILSKIEVKPEEALMVGNDCQEDMVAAEIGVKTFLVNDFVIDRGKPYQAHYRGDLKDLIELI